MAMLMFVDTVDDSQLSALKENKKARAEYLQANRAEDFGPNHRNVGIFDWILNGDVEVTGPRGLFASWLKPKRFSSYRIDDENFGMPSADVVVLLQALKEISPEDIKERWELWCELKGIDEDDDPEFFPESFAYLTNVCERAVSNKQALVWLAG